MTKYSDIKNYFKQIAIDLLNHTEEDKRFFRKGLDEFLNNLQIAANGPIMLLENYDFSYGDNSYDSLTKIRTVGFIIARRVRDISDYDAVDLAYEDCELIVDSIIDKFKSDSKDQRDTIMKFASINEIQATPIQNIADGFYGHFVTFDVSSIHNLN